MSWSILNCQEMKEIETLNAAAWQSKKDEVLSFHCLGVLCPSCTHFSWVPVCNVRAIWKMAGNANKTLCLSSTAQCSYSHAGPEHPELAALRLMQCTPRGALWQCPYTYHEEPWAPVHEKS